MRFGIYFVPTVGPDEMDAGQFYAEALDLCEAADSLGYDFVKIVEHYFFDYGGYCPDPVTFLAAASQRTRSVRLNGSVIPSFSHPIRLAGKLAMLDHLSGGRLDVGYGRAFLPSEFDAFQVPLEESRSLFEETIAAIDRLWSEREVTWKGHYHKFGPLTMLPRPRQQPRPPIWITATFTPELFEWAGKMGHYLTVVPYVSTRENILNLLTLYRGAWRNAGHPPGAERVQMSFHLYVSEDGDQARQEAREYYEDYTRKLLQAAAAWSSRKSNVYPGYEHFVQAVRKSTFEHALEAAKLLVGTPDEVASQLEHNLSWYGEFEPGLQVMFGNMPCSRARRSLELFASQVMPRFS